VWVAFTLSDKMQRETYTSVSEKKTEHGHDVIERASAQFA